MRSFLRISMMLAALAAPAGEVSTLLKQDRSILEDHIDKIRAEARQSLADLSTPYEGQQQPQLRNAPDEIERRKNSAIVQSTQAYLAILEETWQRLTRKGAAEDAHDVQAEIQRARTDPAYASACQGLHAPGSTWTAADAGSLRAKTAAIMTATGPTWDPTKEFSATNNPSGVWSYGWTPTLAGAVTLFRAHRPDANLDGWLKGEPDYPAIWINHTKRVYDGVRPGELSLHPNLSSECAVLRWTSPKASRVVLKGTFGEGDTGAMNVYVLHNNTPCFQVLETRRDEPFAIELRVERGDRVDFVAEPGRAGHGWGNTPIDVTISAM